MKIQARIVIVAVLTVLVALSAGAGAAALEEPLTLMEQLGKHLLFDSNLSTPAGQSCAACHSPETGYTGPDPLINEATAVYPGAVFTRCGNRKPPTAAYGGESPVLFYDEVEEVWVGGMFWDGRATGWALGDPLAEQAMGPFLNPLEQNNPNMRFVVESVARSSYADLFEEVWGPGSLDFKHDVAGSYERIARSIAAYERSSEVNPFSSRFDAFWDAAHDAGLDVTAIDSANWADYAGYGLEGDALEGLGLFNDETKGKCSLCHTLDVGSAGYPLFTDFTYDNLGVPKNPDNPYYDMPRKWNPDGDDWVDPGLGGFLQAEGFSEDVYMAAWGMHKVPTLRNVDKRPYDGFVKAFGHNGYFKSLEDITHFYNTRDVPDEMWPEPEVAINVNTDQLGDLGLTAAEEAKIVAFMRSLSDQ